MQIPILADTTKVISSHYGVLMKNLGRGFIENKHSTDVKSPPHPTCLYEHSHVK